MSAPEWFHPLLAWFAWKEDDHHITITCRRCTERSFWGQHLHPLTVLIDCLDHRRLARCEIHLPPRPQRKV